MVLIGGVLVLIAAIVALLAGGTLVAFSQIEPRSDTLVWSGFIGAALFITLGSIILFAPGPLWALAVFFVAIGTVWFGSNVVAASVVLPVLGGFVALMQTFQPAAVDLMSEG